MGGSASTRRVVVEDTGGEEYVTISEAVARRLKGQADREVTVKDRETVPASPPPIRAFDPESKPIYHKNKELDEFYARKLQDLQERNAALQKITNEQFASAVKEVEQKFLNVTASPVCQDLQARVFECYQSNPREVLNCSALVTAFTTCVDRARMSATASRVQLVN
ncbi:hypothetical protein BsWGS_13892 [Bradybaena similaris]